ncbi:hypothetical protein Mpsy_0589 [Methanolobus psychrophilus R15]|nr:hypothetical protein Mpsy_0589 [Methanolobus psychrophilus R15]
MPAADPPGIFERKTLKKMLFTMNKTNAETTISQSSFESVLNLRKPVILFFSF